MTGRAFCIAVLCGIAAPAAAGETETLAALRHQAAARRSATLAALTEADAEHARIPTAVRRLLERDPVPRVRLAAAQALRRLRVTSAAGACWTAAERDGDPEVAEAAARACGSLSDARRVARLLTVLRSGSPRTRLAAALALGEAAGGATRPALERTLLADDAWAVRAAAALALVPIADDSAIQALYARTQLDRHAAVRAAAAEALEQITGRALGPDPEAWKRARHAGDLKRKPPAPAPPAPGPGRSTAAVVDDHWTVTYWGLTLVPDGTLFCFDVSGSMNYYERLGLARRELESAVAQMRSTDRFGLLFFNEHAALWRDRFVPAGPLAKWMLARHMEEQEAKGYTDLLAMFHRAFGVGGQGRFARAVPERIRTMCVLTDGVPSRQFVRDPAVIRRAVAALNPGRRTVVHTIGLGSSDEAFLKALAGENGGTFVGKQH